MEDHEGGGFGIGHKEVVARGFENDVVEDRSAGRRCEFDPLQENGLGAFVLAQLPHAELGVVLAAGDEDLALLVVDDTPGLASAYARVLARQ